MAIIQEARGDFEEAMRLCQQSLEISDGLGDKLGKSTALHQMAGIYVTRGNLNEAMKLYQQALEIKESLSDLRGKAITLAMMGQVLWNFKHYSEGLRTLLNSIETLRNIGAKPDVEKITNIIIAMQNDIGAKNFSILWQEENGNPIPEWLKQKPKQK
jgi:tetratricopeptide (TPR) repeat protein